MERPPPPPPPGSDQVRAGAQNATWNRDQIPPGPKSSVKPLVEPGPNPPGYKTRRGPQKPADRPVSTRESGSDFRHRPPKESEPPPPRGSGALPARGGHGPGTPRSPPHPPRGSPLTVAALPRAGGGRRAAGQAAERRGSAEVTGGHGVGGHDGADTGARLSPPRGGTDPAPPVGPREGSGGPRAGSRGGVGALLQPAPEPEHSVAAIRSAPRAHPGDVASLGTSGLRISGQTPGGMGTKHTRDQTRL